MRKSSFVMSVCKSLKFGLIEECWILTSGSSLRRCAILFWLKYWKNMCLHPDMSLKGELTDSWKGLMDPQGSLDHTLRMAGLTSPLLMGG